MIEIDAALGEGGGQIVRTALALAMCTGAAVRLRHIRARRAQPGLRAQHLSAVRAAARICAARVRGAEIGSSELSFEPGPVQPGRYEIDIGTAGSTMLVLQTILPALSGCARGSELILRGGTHNPLAPSFEFVAQSWLPVIRQVGFRAQLALQRHGFFPAGGGCVTASIAPLQPGTRLELLDRGPLQSRSAQALIAGLPAHVAERELAVLRERLQLPPEACGVRSVAANGAGNAVQLRLDFRQVTSLFVAFGARGVPAETVAHRVADEAQHYLRSGAAVEGRLADQILLPLALTNGGTFSSLPPSLHTSTNAAVIRRFLPIDYVAEAQGGERSRISVGAGSVLGAGRAGAQCSCASGRE